MSFKKYKDVEKLKKIIKISVKILITTILIITILGITISCYIFLSPNPPEPKITYGEFPFELVYKIDGEVVIVKDTYICEFDGFAWNEGVGKYRKWKGYIKGTGEPSILITEDSQRKVYCFVGSAEFYMNDEEYPEKRPLTPRLYDVENSYDIDSYLPEELMDYYKIDIVSWDFSAPIKNSFN